MRTLAKNKQKLKYALFHKNEPEYVLDENGEKIIEFVDEDGNIYYKQTGNLKTYYGDLTEFLGNISLSGGESREVNYGVDVSAYDAVLVMDKDALPITETSLIWHESEVGYKDVEKTEIDAETADYNVTRVSPSLNQVKYLLERVVK